MEVSCHIIVLAATRICHASVPIHLLSGNSFFARLDRIFHDFIVVVSERRRERERERED